MPRQNLFPQQIHAVALERGNGNVRREIVHRLIPLDQRQQLRLLAQLVDLVEHRDGRGSGFLHQVDAPRVLVAEASRRVHQEQHHVRIGRRPYLIHHALVEQRRRLVDSRRVHEHDLRSRQPQHALDGRARGLRPRRDNGQLGSQQRIQQRGFPGVGPAENRNESRSMLHVASIFRLLSPPVPDPRADCWRPAL